MPGYTISTIALRTANGKFVCVENGCLVAKGDEQRGSDSKEFKLSDSSKFKLIECEPGMRDSLLSNNGGDNFIGIQAVTTSGYVTAPIRETKKGWFSKTRENSPLEAKVSKLDAWERFKLVDLGNGNVALQAHNGKYVCAEGGGGQHLIANRDQIGFWETFTLFKSFASVEGDYWRKIDDSADPATEFYKFLATGSVTAALTVLKIPGASAISKTVVDKCFSLIVPQDPRLEIENRIRSIAKDSVAKSKRDELVRSLSAQEDNWNQYRDLKFKDIGNYYNRLESIENDVNDRVKQSIELDLDSGKYLGSSSIETLLYTFECFGRLSLLHLALLQELIEVSDENIKPSKQTRLNEKTEQYKRYAQIASNLIIQDRLNYMEFSEKRDNVEGVETAYKQLADRYYDNRNPVVISESYNELSGWVGEGSIDAYRTFVRNRLAAQHTAMIPFL